MALVQARMGSTRLPGKVLQDLGGMPLLGRVLERLGRAKRVRKIVVATTANPADDPLVKYLRSTGVASVRGPEEDVLARFQLAAEAHPAESYLRVSSDCPLLSPSVVDSVIGLLPGADYASTSREPRTFPIGIDVEAFTADALRSAYEGDRNPAWREHVTPFIYRHPERFRLRELRCDSDLSHIRWTVDTPEDLAMARAVYAHFKDQPFDLDELLAAWRQNPAWQRLNAGVPQKTVPR